MHKRDLDKHVPQIRMLAKMHKTLYQIADIYRLYIQRKARKKNFSIKGCGESDMNVQTERKKKNNKLYQNEEIGEQNHLKTKC